MINKSHLRNQVKFVKRQLQTSAIQQRSNNPTHVNDTQHPTHSSLKQHDAHASTTKDVRFSNPPGIPFCTSLQSPSRQQQPSQPDNQDRYASLSNVDAVDAVFAALPNENSLKADPNLPDLMRTLTDTERDMARETYFQINPFAERICQTARLDGTVTILPGISIPVNGVLLDSGASMTFSVP